MKCNHVAGESITADHLKEAGEPGMRHRVEFFPVNPAEVNVDLFIL
jgi:hypothetical protein